MKAHQTMPSQATENSHGSQKKVISALQRIYLVIISHHHNVFLQNDLQYSSASSALNIRYVTFQIPPVQGISKYIFPWHLIIIKHQKQTSITTANHTPDNIHRSHKNVISSPQKIWIAVIKSHHHNASLKNNLYTLWYNSNSSSVTHFPSMFSPATSSSR